MSEQFKTFIDEPIDIVLLWVSEADITWNRLYKKYIGPIIHDRLSPNLDELELCLYSITKFMNWIRTIWIVTECSLPDYTDQYSKIKVIPPHKLIYGYANIPNFNSFVIQSNLHRIPNLSENFIVGCDDYFIGSTIEKQEWFDINSNKPITNLIKIDKFKYENILYKSQFSYYNANRLMEIYRKNKLIKYVHTHQFNLINKASCNLTWKIFEPKLREFGKHRIKNPVENQINTILLIQLVGVTHNLLKGNIKYNPQEYNLQHIFGMKNNDEYWENDKASYQNNLNYLLNHTPKLYSINYLTEDKKSIFNDFKQKIMNKKYYSSNSSSITIQESSNQSIHESINNKKNKNIKKLKYFISVN